MTLTPSVSPRLYEHGDIPFTVEFGAPIGCCLQPGYSHSNQELEIVMQVPLGVRFYNTETNRGISSGFLRQKVGSVGNGWWMQFDSAVSRIVFDVAVVETTSKTEQAAWTAFSIFNKNVLIHSSRLCFTHDLRQGPYSSCKLMVNACNDISMRFNKEESTEATEQPVGRFLDLKGLGCVAPRAN